MTRNELKNLWFSIPKQDNKKEIKAIVVDVKSGYSSFKTHQVNPIEYVMNREEYKSGSHQLIIK